MSVKTLVSVALISCFVISNAYSMGKQKVRQAPAPQPVMAKVMEGGEGGDGKGTIGGHQDRVVIPQLKGTIGEVSTDKGTIGSYEMHATCVDENGVLHQYYRSDAAEKKAYFRCLRDLMDRLGEPETGLMDSLSSGT